MDAMLILLSGPLGPRFGSVSEVCAEVLNVAVSAVFCGKPAGDQLPFAVQLPETGVQSKSTPNAGVAKATNSSRAMRSTTLDVTQPPGSFTARWMVILIWGWVFMGTTAWMVSDRGWTLRKIEHHR